MTQSQIYSTPSQARLSLIQLISSPSIPSIASLCTATLQIQQWQNTELPLPISGNVITIYQFLKVIKIIRKLTSDSSSAHMGSFQTKAFPENQWQKK